MDNAKIIRALEEEAHHHCGRHTHSEDFISLQVLLLAAAKALSAQQPAEPVARPVRAQQPEEPDEESWTNQEVAGRLRRDAFVLRHAIAKTCELGADMLEAMAQPPREIFRNDDSGALTTDWRLADSWKKRGNKVTQQADAAVQRTER